MATSVLWLASLGVVGLPVASADADKVDGALAQRVARADVKVVAGVAPGSYPIAGAVTDAATGVRRQIAGTQAVMAAFSRE